MSRRNLYSLRTRFDRGEADEREERALASARAKLERRARAARAEIEAAARHLPDTFAPLPEEPLSLWAR